MARDIINVGDNIVAELVRRGVNKEAAIRAVQATNNVRVLESFRQSDDMGNRLGLIKRWIGCENITIHLEILAIKE